MAIDVLEEHKRLVKARSREAWFEYAGRARLREIAAYNFGFLGMLSGVVFAFLLFHYQASVVVQTHTRTTDRFGQVVGDVGAVYRVPADVSSHSVITSFIHDVFTVYNSGPALQRNYIEAQSEFVDGNSGVVGVLKQYWDENSPLKSDLKWEQRLAQERAVEVTSILDRGAWSQGKSGTEEYEVEWTVAPIGGDGRLGPRALFKGDLALGSGGARTDANPFGLQVSHFTWSELQ